MKTRAVRARFLTTTAAEKGEAMFKIALAALAALVLALSASALAQTALRQTGPVVTPVPVTTPQQAAAPAVTLGPHALTADDLRAFLDGFVLYSIQRGDIAGATIAVVKDGSLLFANGYGFSDLKTRAPVVADRTMFRPGSTSKLFTWTAVMQLVEQGKLDLDRDVNQYLDFKVPDAFGKPITLRNCMTHTSGFEEAVSDLIVGKPEDLYPLHDYLVKRMPRRIFPPGQVIAYSNYCTTLAGYIVQRISGEPFADYIANHIFKPLGMAHSTFGQPLPKSLEPDMATGYKTASGAHVVPFELVEAAPAGSLSATSADMARFMIAYLSGGDGILKPETVKLMWTRQHSIVPELNGFNLGFYDENRNGHRIVGHAGDLNGFHSDLHLIVDSNAGFFVSFNSTGKEGAAGQLRTALFRAFLDRYFPKVVADEAAVANPKADAARVVGSYRSSRRKESALRVLWLLGQTQVAAKPDGTIQIDAFKDFSGAPKTWRNIGPLTYREIGGPAHMKFLADAQGNVQSFFTDDSLPVLELQRVTGLEESRMLKLLGLLCIVILLSTVTIWIGGAILRWHYGKPLQMTRETFWLRLGSRIGAVLFLAVAFGWLGFVTLVSADNTLLFGGKANVPMDILYTVGVLAILSGILMVVHAGLRVVRGPGRWLVRAGEVLVGLAAMYGIWAVLDLGLANFNTNL